MAFIDTISPTYIGEDRIVLTVDPDSEPLRAFKPLTILADYTDAEPEGISVPLELIINPMFDGGGVGKGYKRTLYKRSAPTRINYRPPFGGSYLVLLREVQHNRWQGRLIIDVGGDKFSEPIVRSRS